MYVYLRCPSLYLTLLTSVNTAWFLYIQYKMWYIGTLNRIVPNIISIFTSTAVLSFPSAITCTVVWALCIGTGSSIRTSIHHRTLVNIYITWSKIPYFHDTFTVFCHIIRRFLLILDNKWVNWEDNAITRVSLYAHRMLTHTMSSNEDLPNTSQYWTM